MYCIGIFPNDNTFIPPFGVRNFRVLAIGGGSGGTGGGYEGGSSGFVLSKIVNITSGGRITVIVGRGGNKSEPKCGAFGGEGGHSSFGLI